MRAHIFLNVLFLTAMTASAFADGVPRTQPATAPTTQPAIPLVYASKDGKPFPDFPPKELARILKRAGDIVPPGKDIWFILVRNGTWFPAAEVYCVPEKVNGRLCSGRSATIWREDSEQAIMNLNGGNHWDDYVWVVEPSATVPKITDGKIPPVPQSNWLPFRRPCKDDKLIVSLVDAVQNYRQSDKEAAPDARLPIMGIQREGNNFNVLVAWPDQGYEDFCTVKPIDGGLQAVGWSLVAH